MKRDKDLFDNYVPIEYFKCVESKDDDGWLLAYSCGLSNDGKSYVVTTNNLKCDEIPIGCEDAKEFGELIAKLLNQHFNK